MTQSPQDDGDEIVGAWTKAQFSEFVLVALAKQTDLNIQMAGILTELVYGDPVDPGKITAVLRQVDVMGQDFEEFIAKMQAEEL